MQPAGSTLLQIKSKAKKGKEWIQGQTRLLLAHCVCKVKGRETSNIKPKFTA